VEVEMMKTVAEFLGKLKATKEDGVSLLDRTMVFFGSNLGNASSHATKNLPIFLAGGGFRHGQHLAFDPQTSPPLCNLFVSMLQRLGLPVDKFGSSTGTLTDWSLPHEARPEDRRPGAPRPPGRRRAGTGVPASREEPARGGSGEDLLTRQGRGLARLGLRQLDAEEEVRHLPHQPSVPLGAPS
jgi:hypothetical protein